MEKQCTAADFEKKCLRWLRGVRIISPCDADMAQLVEHHLAKVGVAGSNPVVRSIVCDEAGHIEILWPAFFWDRDGDVAKW